MLAIGADVTQLSEFRDVFGMRFLGLIDPSSSVYGAWRVPDPTAPYPQDYVLDQQGRVAYWNDQFDPQEVMAVIDRLLASGTEEMRNPGAKNGVVTFVRRVLRLPADGGCLRPVLLDIAGREAMALRPGPNDVRRLAPGVYFLHGAGLLDRRVILLR